jgi:hypothetical protein
MNQAPASPPLSLYEQDETAWLEHTASLVAQRRFSEVDFENLSEYLSDMAKRDRREVFRRLRVLLTHLLKWQHQPKKRSRSWRGTIMEQRSELRQLLESGTLRRQANEVLNRAYKEAVEQAGAETGLDVDVFPSQCPHSVDDLLAGGKGV